MNFKEIISECFQETASCILHKTERFVVVRVDNTSTIIFNSLLNSPLMLGAEAFEWFKSHNVITEKLFDNLDEETKNVVEMLLRSYLYFPPNKDEETLCHKVNSEYLNSFMHGITFSWLDLRVSESCNFGCPHCIASRATTGRIMTFENARRYISSYVEFKRSHDSEFNTLRIHFGNCEPLINFDIIHQIVEYCSIKYGDLNVEYSINTNLSLLTSEMAAFFAENGVAVYTSLDGPQKANDAIRTYRNGSGTYYDIISKMDIMKTAGYAIEGISVTITDLNYIYIDDSFVQWCCDMGFKSVALDFDLIHSTRIPVNEKVALLCNLWVRFTKLGIEFFGTWMTPFINLSNRTPSVEAYAFCKAMAGKNISVDSQGNIYACSYSNTPICNFSDLEKAIAPSGTYYSLVKRHLVGETQYLECKGCFIEGACNGQCNMTRQCCSDIKEIGIHCKFYKAVTMQMLIAQAILLEEVSSNESKEDA